MRTRDIQRKTQSVEDWDGQPFYSWLEGHHAYGPSEIRGLALQLRFAAQRVRAVRAHNAEALEKQYRLTRVWATKERPVCSLCGWRGFITKQLASVCRPCMGYGGGKRNSMQLSELRRSIDLDP